ncbi:alpha/beta hydrolase [Alicyclobacillus sendaiensis]|uniref:alpha/beta hydrolase n=1 Tax=Alicyclobacillus sendaiensis TaxID=192387 RepID=UPI0026F41A87|nr:alpha/beta hydrolase [Alicyclobacillus sendaiensis]
MPSPQALSVRAMLQQVRASQNPAELSLEAQRAGLDQMGRTIPQPADVAVERTSFGGVPGEWITVAESSDKRVVLYLHGGAYYMGSCESHRSLAWRLARASKSRVALIEYRLAPEHKFPAAVEDAVKAYESLLALGVEPGRIAISGDSAGGGLTMATLISLRDAGKPLPACAALLSPWTDLAGTGPSMESRAPYDPWLEPEGIRKAPLLYCSRDQLTHPLVSPLYGDLADLPPILIHVGRDECLLDDSVRLYDKLIDAGVQAKLHVWDDLWHVFHSFPIPEADEALNEIGLFIQEHIPS